MRRRVSELTDGRVCCVVVQEGPVSRVRRERSARLALLVLSVRPASLDPTVNRATPALPDNRANRCPARPDQRAPRGPRAPSDSRVHRASLDRKGLAASKANRASPDPRAGREGRDSRDSWDFRDRQAAKDLSEAKVFC